MTMPLPKKRLTVYYPTVRVRASNPATGEIIEGPYIAVVNRIADWLQWTDEECRIERLDRS